RHSGEVDPRIPVGDQQGLQLQTRQPGLAVAEFGRLAGEGLRVVAAAPGPYIGEGAGLGMPELMAEAALLQARLDWFQEELARFTGDQRG
ncbi:hypothetical protein ABZ369_40425, partial [Streptomyces sp. NPDC005918]